MMAEIAREVEKHYPHAALRDRRLENVDADDRDLDRRSGDARQRRTADRRSSSPERRPATRRITSPRFARKRASSRSRPTTDVARRLALLWGTESLLIDRYASIDVLLYMTEQHMVRAGLVHRATHRLHHRHAGRLGRHQRAQDPPDPLGSRCAYAFCAACRERACVTNGDRRATRPRACARFRPRVLWRRASSRTAIVVSFLRSIFSRT